MPECPTSPIMVIPLPCALCEHGETFVFPMHSTAMQPVTRFLLPLFTGITFALHAAGPISADSSANLEPTPEDAAKSGFLMDTNRAFPMLFIVGDSTVHNPTKGELGWGDVLGKYFDAKKIRVENHARGGRSSRTYRTQGWWAQVLTNSKPGDFVLLQMGHNDGGPLDDTTRARGSIRGLGDDTRDILNSLTKKPETVHTYGWYMRQYIADAHAKGMTLVLCTPIPHCPRDEVHAGDVENSSYVKFSQAVAESEKVPFIHLNQITTSHYAGMKPEEIKQKYFTSADNTHTSPAGAELNAQSVIEGLRQLKGCPLTDFLLPKPAE
jgi:rhamnogalacturonan acetylesterase